VGDAPVDAGVRRKHVAGRHHGPRPRAPRSRTGSTTARTPKARSSSGSR
jgi:hypothetical protein